MNNSDGHHVKPKVRCHVLCYSLWYKGFWHMLLRLMHYDYYATSLNLHCYFHSPGVASSLTLVSSNLYLIYWVESWKNIWLKDHLILRPLNQRLQWSNEISCSFLTLTHKKTPSIYSTTLVGIYLSGVPPGISQKFFVGGLN